MTTTREIILDRTSISDRRAAAPFNLYVAVESSAHATMWLRPGAAGSAESAWDSSLPASFEPFKVRMTGVDTVPVERVFSGHPPARWWERLPHGMRGAVEAWIDRRDQRSAAARYGRTAGARLTAEERVKLESSLRRRGWDAESSAHLDG